jgi:hypothetical protein
LSVVILNAVKNPRISSLEQRDLERRSQVRGLLLLAVAAIVFAILRAGVHRVFTVGWWRLW